jgi:hypothetical protein
VHVDDFDIVDFETFECEAPVFIGCLTPTNRQRIAAPSHIVYFDDSKAETEPIPDIFYRWETEGKTIRVGALPHVMILVHHDLFTFLAGAEEALQGQSRGL